MDLPRKHHYNPVFVLRRWAGDDGKLCEMKRINGAVAPRRRHPPATGFVRDLYRVEGVTEELSQNLETSFMSPLDNGAAAALQRMLERKMLDTEQRAAWARFLMSMLYRNPDGVETIKSHMAEMWREGTAALEDAYAASRSSDDERTFAEATAKREPGAVGISTANMMADIIGNSRAVPDICKMHWTCVDVGKSDITLLTSDRPLVMPVGLAHPLCYVALSIGPRNLFVAARDDRFAKVLPAAGHCKVVKAMNRDVVQQARQVVWGSDDTQVDFVRKHIGVAPDRAIMTEEQRRQIIAVARGLQPPSNPMRSAKEVTKPYSRVAKRSSTRAGDAI